MVTRFHSPSDLDYRVTLQQEAQTADGGGGYALAWSTVATVYAEVRPLRGQEIAQAARLQAVTSHMIVIRYREGVTAGMRVLWGTRTFNIRQVLDPEEAHVWLELYCDEGVAT